MKGLRQIVLYPIVMALIWIPNTIAGILEDPFSEYDTNPSSIVQQMTLPCMGLATFFCFVLTADVAQDFRQMRGDSSSNHHKKVTNSGSLPNYCRTIQ